MFSRIAFVTGVLCSPQSLLVIRFDRRDLRRYNRRMRKRWLIVWLRRNVAFLTITLGICCYLEIVMGLLEGTNPNTEFPWGHYHETLAVIGASMLVIGYFARNRTQALAESARLHKSKAVTSRESSTDTTKHDVAHAKGHRRQKR